MNTTFTVVVAEQDNFGNTITTDSTTAVALAANNGGGGFSCTVTPTHVTNGVATYTGCSYTIASGTAYTLTASSTGAHLGHGHHRRRRRGDPARLHHRAACDERGGDHVLRRGRRGGHLRQHRDHRLLHDPSTSRPTTAGGGFHCSVAPLT